MRNILIYSLLGLGLITATPSRAGTFDAREVARINNCQPKKVDVFDQKLGTLGETTYKVECDIPKTTGGTDKGNKASSVLILCTGSLCHFLRPIANSSK